MRRIVLALFVAASMAVSACSTAKGNLGGDGGPDPGDAGVSMDAGPSIDAQPAVNGHNARATVPGGVQAASPNYKLIKTTGRSDSTATSPNYKHRGGVVGASQE